ncbi:hypothetical protein RB195_004033 [Necator americanus]|uniref:Uncharacterized protein n=1 Tax=Necator americanus TaxID=51031 RepID=A0ABR1BKL6_NECAM
MLKRPANRFVQRVVKSSSGPNWKTPHGRKWKFKRDVRFPRLWNNMEKVENGCMENEMIDSVQASVEDRERWAEILSRMTDLGEDADNRVGR